MQHCRHATIHTDLDLVEHLHKLRLIKLSTLVAFETMLRIWGMKDIVLSRIALR